MNEHILNTLLYVFEHEWRSFCEHGYRKDHIWYESLMGLLEEYNLTLLYDVINKRAENKEIDLEYSLTLLSLKNETKN